MGSEWLMGGEYRQCGYAGQRHDSHPRWDGTRFLHTTRNSVQFKTQEVFISGIFYLTFSDCDWPHVTEMKRKTADNGVLLYKNTPYA